MTELCKLSGIEKLRTTVYHPMCNGLAERFNRTLISMLGTLELEKKQDWKSHIQLLVYSYNAIPHESTKVAPFELMFGRKPLLPVDLRFDSNTRSNASEFIQNDYVKDLKLQMEKTRQIASAHLERARVKQKAQFDKKVNVNRLEVGDSVLVKKLAFDGPHKLADKFEEGIVRIIRQPNPDIPVFQVESEDGSRKTLHRNHLYLVHMEPEADSVSVTDSVSVEQELDSVAEHWPCSGSESSFSSVSESDVTVADDRSFATDANRNSEVGDAHHTAHIQTESDRYSIEEIERDASRPASRSSVDDANEIDALQDTG